MEQEMRKLGLKKSISKSTLEKINNTEEFSNKEKFYPALSETTSVEKPPPSTKTKSYARRMSTIGIVSTKTNEDEFANVKKIRKYSLDNDLFGKTTKSLTSASMVKSFRRLSKNDLKAISNGKSSPSLFAPSVSIKTDMSDWYSPSVSANPRNISRTQTASVFSRNRSSISTYSSALNLPKLSRLSFSRAASSTNLRKTSRNKENSSVTSKRRVSFGQIDLNNLDNPKMYRYSNSAAYERYKFNPHYYLPDGSLKRKFSLPKLCDTLEAVKNCNYLRRNSIESTADQIEIVNIFREDQKLINSAESNATPTRELNYNSVIISNYE